MIIIIVIIITYLLPYLCACWSGRCNHSRCPRDCGSPCDPCREPCLWVCSHFRCTRLCHEACNRPRCNQPCPRRLPCGHPCIGMCGEMCPSVCRQCDRVEVTEVFFGLEDEPDARFVQLQDCKHVFEVCDTIRYDTRCPIGERSIVMSVSVCVCLSVCV